MQQVMRSQPWQGGTAPRSCSTRTPPASMSAPCASPGREWGNQCSFTCDIHEDDPIPLASRSPTLEPRMSAAERKSRCRHASFHAHLIELGFDDFVNARRDDKRGTKHLFYELSFGRTDRLHRPTPHRDAPPTDVSPVNSTTRFRPRSVVFERSPSQRGARSASNRSPASSPSGNFAARRLRGSLPGAGVRPPARR